MGGAPNLEPGTTVANSFKFHIVVYDFVEKSYTSICHENLLAFNSASYVYGMIIAFILQKVFILEKITKNKSRCLQN